MLENSATVFVYYKEDQKEGKYHFTLRDDVTEGELIHQMDVSDGQSALDLLLSRFHPDATRAFPWFRMAEADVALVHRLTGGTVENLIAQLANAALPGGDSLSYKATLKRLGLLWWSVEQNHNGRYLQDDNGFIMTRQEWETLRPEIDAFYLQTRDEDLYRTNLRRLGQQLPRSAA